MYLARNKRTRVDEVIKRIILIDDESKERVEKEIQILKKCVSHIINLYINIGSSEHYKNKGSLQEG